MSDTTQYDPERHDNQVVAAFETIDIAAAARDAVIDAGVPRESTHVIARKAEPAETEPVGEQILGAFMGLFSSREDHRDYQQAVHHGHALLAVDIGAGVDRQRVVEIPEKGGALDFEAQRQVWGAATDTAPDGSERREGQRETTFGSNRVRSYIADRG